MSRAEKVAEAQRLRAQGLKLREIGERMGVSTSTAQSLLCDPDLSKHLARRERYRGVCERCGNPTDGSNGYDAPRVCQACNGILGAARAKEAARPQRELVERLWAEGKTCREIGELLGWTGHYLTRGIAILRSRGYNLPYRRTPEQLTRITADNGENLRKARAARKQKAAA